MDTTQESLRLLKEATDDLSRALRNAEFEDWVAVVLFSQLAIEKSTKALIACFEAFRWTRDPSDQLRRLIRNGVLPEAFLTVADYAEEAAVWHGRATYGGLMNGIWRSPADLCTKEVATRLLDRARESVEQTAVFLTDLFGGI